MMVIISRTRIITHIDFLRCFLLVAENVAVPKPRGHFRIDLPEHKYVLFNEKPGKNLNIPLII